MSGTPTLPPALARHYEVERVLASGGFGSVFLARQSALDRRVAIKLLHEGILEDDGQVQRFLLEARITASFDHPHIVRVIDHGIESGVPWIAYEFLEGRSLADLIATGIGPAQALKACAQVASALDVAHAQGVLHRDIKAANVMQSASEHFKVTDFGIARWTTGERVHTKTGTILGTPSHIAPEVVLGLAAGPPADVYALGVMAFEALAGRVPFGGTSVAEVLTAHVQQPPPPLSALVPGISRNIEAYIAELLHKDPQKRPAPCGEVARRLEALAAEAGAVKGRARRVTTGKLQPVAKTAAASRSGQTEVLATAIADAPRAVRWRPAGAAALAAALLTLALCAVWAVRTPVGEVGPRPSPIVSATPAALDEGPDWDVYGEMARIPGGKAIVGDDSDDDDRPRHQVTLSAFRIDRYEVTNRLMRKFLDAPTGKAYLARRRKDLEPIGGSALTDRKSQELPVVHVTQADAAAFCAWTGRRLPTEAQWERAARGPDGRNYTWGNVLDGQKVIGSGTIKGGEKRDSASLVADLATVFSRPVDRTLKTDDVTPEGVHHLTGNVREWTQDWFWRGYYGHRVANNVDLVDPPGPTPERFPKERIENVVIKGTSFPHQVQMVWSRHDSKPEITGDDTGFRCACLESAVPPGK
jgi:formylglycine-generating enzyme required for sulfatase activity/predicted Ser/Thr protein kinase